MQAQYLSRGFVRLALLAVVVSSALLIFISGYYEVKYYTSEAGLIEILQEIYLGLAAIGFFIAGLRHRAETRMFLIGMAVLMAVFLLRELDLEPVGVITTYMDSRYFRLHETVLVILIAAIYIFMRPNYLKPIFKFLASKQASLFYLAAVLAILGEIFEKMRGFPLNELFEEVFEAASYLLLFCLALRSMFYKPAIIHSTFQTDK